MDFSNFFGNGPSGSPSFFNMGGMSGMSGMGGGGGGMSGLGGMGMSGLAGLLGGMFGDSGAPYDKAMEQFQKYGNMGKDVQTPFLNAGQQGMGNFQNWLSGMQDPSGFINHLMGQYQESPFAKYQQQQGMRQLGNAGSAQGLLGSTPMQLQAQQNAQGIASGDMQNWLSRVLGVNSQYGQGQQNLMNTGQNAANSLTGLYGQLGQQMGEGAYGSQAGSNNDLSNMLGGGAQIAMSLLPFIL